MTDASGQLADVYLFPKTSVEIIKTVDDVFDSSETRKFLIRLIDNEEHIFVYFRWRKVNRKESGEREITIKMITEKDIVPTFTTRKILDDNECNAISQ